VGEAGEREPTPGAVAEKGRGQGRSGPPGVAVPAPAARPPVVEASGQGYNEGDWG
jgi:hypothetical protein